MLNNLAAHLGLKLFILLTAIIIFSIFPLAYMAMQTIKGFAEEIADINGIEIQSQAFSSLQKITRERADKYQAFFDKVAASATMMACHASALYSGMDTFAQSPLNKYTYHLLSDNGIWANDSGAPVTTLYWGGKQMHVEVETELAALSHMKPFFEQALVLNPEALASHMITVSGIGCYYTENPVTKQAVYNLPPAASFDLRDGEPMTIFTDSETPGREVRWTQIYKDDVNDGLMLTASAPVYDHSNTFRGIAGIDVPLGTVTTEILNQHTYDDDIVLFSFLLDQGGNIIAFPEEYFSLFGLTIDKSALVNSSDKLEITLADSTHDVFRNLAAKLLENGEPLHKLVLDSETHYVVTGKMEKPGWIFGVVVREKDLLASIHQTRLLLDNTLTGLEFKGVMLSLLTFFLAAAAIFWTIKYLIMPLRTLAGATQRVAAGDLSVSCPVTTQDEVGTLAKAFNAMVEQLRRANIEQQRYAESLEHEVLRRTAEITDKKTELERTVTQLARESEKGQIAAEALLETQQKYHDTMEASHAGIFIIEDGRFSYVNASHAKLARSTPEAMIGLDPLELITQEDRALVADNMRKRFQGVDIDPYVIKCLRTDGSAYFGEVWAKVTSWQGKQVLVGTILDVSDLRYHQQQLQTREQQLQQSLKEKEVLLREVYHRTKNNMLVIISMLTLQLREVSDQRVKKIFHETENRIRAMALVHEKLYQSKNLAEIELGAYLHDIADTLITHMMLKNRMSLQMDVQPVAINIDNAIPLGLVVNEIVTNSLRHAFPGSRKGSLLLKVSSNADNTIHVTIADNGIGLVNGSDLLHGKTFGMQIIYNLVTMQLKGTITVNEEKGTCYRITFPKTDYIKHIQREFAL